MTRLCRDVAHGPCVTEKVDTEPPNNLVRPLTGFIGRQWEAAEVRALLRRSRLVTVVGVGGAGKSRLALEVAGDCLRDYDGGAWLIDLASLAQPGLVVHAMATVLGVRDHPERPLADLLADRLNTGAALLILDDCDHLLDEVAEAAQRLLRSCPRLTILATSRERLGVAGEVLNLLSGLEVPGQGARTAREVRRADAARLLVERAAAVRPGFRLDDATAGAVAQICRRLDGMPLAIELAAARVIALDVEQIAARLDDRFRLLDHGERTALPRHQTLRAVVDWSYELLSARERQVFDRAAVFVGGFTLEAAEAVCAERGERDGAVAGLVGRLVGKSLVVSENVAVGRRFHLLETLRVYGLERLRERGEIALLRDLHAAYFQSLAEPAGEALRGPEQPAWLEQLEIEHGNFRVALAWSLEQGLAETALNLAGSLYPLWDLHGHYSEGRQWLARALAAEGRVPDPVRVRALLGAATLAVIQGDLEDAAVTCEEVVEICMRTDDAAGMSHALQYLGLGALYADELDDAKTLLDGSLENARIAGDSWLEAWALVFLAAVALSEGDAAESARVAARAETLSRQGGDPECLAWALLVGGMAAWQVDDRAASVVLLRQALLGFQQLSALWGLSMALFMAAQPARARGDQHGCVVLLGAAEALRVSVGAARVPFVGRWLEESVAQTRAVLGDDGFEQAWAAGRALPLNAALTQAMGEFDRASAERV